MSRLALPVGSAGFMEGEQLSELLDALEAIEPDSVRFVGGCVRSALLGEQIDNIDLATSLPVTIVGATIKELGRPLFGHGLAHGVAITRCDGLIVEIAGLRRDVSTDGRHAQIVHIDDWQQDAERRDFRCNAVYADRSGHLFDPVGGIADIKERKIVFIGDAGTRIEEDFLRILRFFRFSAWYAVELDQTGLEAIASRLDGLKRLSGERTGAEMLKLLEAANPLSAIRAMAECGALARVLGCNLLRLDRLERMIATDRHYGYVPEALLRLAALLPVAAIGQAVRRLRLSSAQAERVLEASSEPPQGSMSVEAARVAIYRHGSAAWQDKLRLAWAGAKNHDQQWQDLLALAANWSVPNFPLSGRDVLAAGLQQGAQVGIVLEKLEQWWVEAGFTPSRAELLARLDKEIASL